MLPTLGGFLVKTKVFIVMPVCTKCNIDKPIEEYSLDKQPNKVYRKKYCTECFREQSRDWKKLNKVKKELVIGIPQPKEIIQPVVLELQPVYKECFECKELKPLDKFYLNNRKNPIRSCRTCYNKKYKKTVEEHNKERGGSIRVRAHPNNYSDIWQKEQVFSVMKAFGWIFDEGTGIWNKPGLKENGIFIDIIPKDKPKRRLGKSGGRKLKTGVYNNIEDIVRLVEIGHTYNDIAEVYDCSHTMIRKVVSKYRNEKRAS